MKIFTPSGETRICPKTGRVVGSRRPGWLAWLYPLAGLAALLWVVLRVAPKPDRAAYPCQRAAIPFTSGFVAWLLGLCGWLALTRRIKSRLSPHRSAAVAAGAVSLAVLVLWSIFSAPPSPASAAPIEPANQPIGTARGINPGRVTWVHDPGAAKWDGTDGSHWWDEANNDQGAIDAMLSKALQNLASKTTDSTAWEALFKSFNQRRGRGGAGYKAGEKIAIKINQNCAQKGYAGNGSADANVINSNPWLLKSLLGQLVNRAGVAQENITVYDVTTPWFLRRIADNVYNPNHAAFPKVRFMDAEGKNGREPPAWTAGDVISYATEHKFGRKIPTRVQEAAYVINLALLKLHKEGGITLCGKNHFGSLNAIGDHNVISASNNAANSYAVLVELMGHKDLGEKTVLFLIDGLYGAPGVMARPVKWNKAPFNGAWPSSLLLSQDGVAIDSVAFDFLNGEFGVSVPNADNYLHEAALANDPPSKTAYKPGGAALPSLGVHEHWNNATERKYTRNLGTGKGIELATPGAPRKP